MAQAFELGINYNFIALDQDVPPLRRFEMVRDSGVYDYINWLPRPELVDACLAASARTGVPMTTGNYTHTYGDERSTWEDAFRIAARVGNRMMNVMLLTYAADGHELTDAEIVESYLRCWELGERHGVTPCFEVHVNCWSEKYLRIRPVAEAVRARGIPFNFTIDYSHVLFKIENPEELEISGVRDAVAAGRVILDPFEPGNLCDEWLEMNMVVFAQYRPAVPNGPRNVWALGPDGAPGRGIIYPFLKPQPGECHSPWYAYKLEASKEFVRRVMRYHLTHPASPLRYVITELIVQPDYAMNAKWSVWEHSVASARWLRAQWAQLEAMQAAGIPLAVL
jgi:hypothetical protein